MATAMTGVLVQQKRNAQFRGFGPSILVQQTRGRRKRIQLPDDRLACRRLLHEECPLCPGVYAWLDANQQICYVGKSKSLRKRLLTYFAKNLKEKKVERILQTSRTLVWEPLSDELLALIREQELIFRWRPEFNTQGQPVKRQPAFLVIKNGPAPLAAYTQRIPANAMQIFGPISGTGRLRSAVESINQIFHLRDCADKTKFSFADQLQLFENATTAKCIRYELNSCPAPCAAKCTQAQYADHVQQAMNFIAGQDHATLLNLEYDMKTASAGQSFERATILRDHLANLRWLDRRMQALRFARQNYNGVLPVAARKKRIAWLVLKGGRLLGSAAKPLRPNRAQSAIEYLQVVARQPIGLPESIMDMNLQMILVRWFRKYKQTLDRLIPFDRAIELCREMESSAPRPNHSGGS